MMSGSAESHANDPLRARYLAERDKRLRADGEAQYLEASGDYEDFVRDPHVDTPLVREAIDREVDVAVIGGGFGGLLTGAKLTDAGQTDFLIVEQGGDFGGTWYWNRYPGVRCDIESYIYMPLLEEVGTVPRERYAAGAEIFEHCRAIGRHYGLYDRALFQTKVDRIAWDAGSARWHITTDRGDVLRARFVTMAQGPLAKVKLPNLPGIRDFRGRIFHSSRWDYGYTGGDASGGQIGLADKKVAVIGTGATAIQIVPRLADHAQSLLLFQRTPSAIDQRDNAPTDADWFGALPKGWQRERMNNFLSIITGRPQPVDMVGDGWTDFWKRIGARMKARAESGSDEDPHAIVQGIDYAKMDEIRARVGKIVEDPAVAAAVTPWYNYLCKRPLYSDEFLQALNRPNVTLVDTDGKGVEAITATGVVAGGRDYPVDCIVFATGFDVGAAPHKVGGYELVGRDGIDIDSKWAGGARTLHGTQMHGFPNLHIVGGTAQGTTAFNFTHTLDMQAGHAVELIQGCLTRGVRILEVTEDAEARWLAAMEAAHVDHDQFYEDCTPGFLNNEGRFRERPTYVGGTYGGGPLEYERIITEWRAGGVDRDCVVAFEDGRVMDPAGRVEAAE